MLSDLAQSNDSELPSYSPPSPTRQHRSSPLTQHSFHFAKNGRAWLTLRTTSSAEGPDDTPEFAQGDKITGSVEIDLDSETVIRSVVVSVSISLILLLNASFWVRKHLKRLHRLRATGGPSGGTQW